jgi:hypothetical protein
VFKKNIHNHEFKHAFEFGERGSTEGETLPSLTKEKNKTQRKKQNTMYGATGTTLLGGGLVSALVFQLLIRRCKE